MSDFDRYMNRLSRIDRYYSYDSETDGLNDRWNDRENKMTEKKARLSKKEINKFYIGSGDMARAIENGKNSDNSRATFKEVADMAAEKLTKDPTVDSIIIVKIVGIVRRKVAPITVEKL